MAHDFDYEWHRLELRFEQLSQHLDRVPGEALPHLIKYFATQATLLRRKRRAIDERSRRQRKFNAEHPPDPDFPDTPNGRARRRAAERTARAMEIMRLASRGWSNGAIGRRVDLTAGRVSQIIQQQLKLTRKEPAP